MDIFQKIGNLHLPAGKYAVFGSAIMHAHGIREARDLDVLVTRDVYDNLKQEGWPERLIKENVTILEKDEVDAFYNAGCGNYQPNTEELIRSAQVINGFPFVKLEELTKFKTAKNTEKDLKDVEMINDYIKKTGSVNLT